MVNAYDDDQEDGVYRDDDTGSDCDGDNHTCDGSDNTDFVADGVVDDCIMAAEHDVAAVSYTHLRAHETGAYL
eukprot:8057587-Pyramimonas_sp.AAC.1